MEESELDDEMKTALLEIEEWSREAISSNKQEVDTDYSATVEIADLVNEVKTLDMKSEREIMSSQHNAEEWKVAAKNFEKQMEEAERDAEQKTAPLESEIHTLK